MFFLVFFLLGVIVWTVGLPFVLRSQKSTGTYSALSLLFVLTGMIVFTFLSWGAGIIPLSFGDGALVTYSVSFPHGYLAQGVLGFVIVLVGLAGVLSPVLAVWLTDRQPGERIIAP
jgi:hypothetical protein